MIKPVVRGILAALLMRARVLGPFGRDPLGPKPHHGGGARCCKVLAFGRITAPRPLAGLERNDAPAARLVSGGLFKPRETRPAPTPLGVLSYHAAESLYALPARARLGMDAPVVAYIVHLWHLRLGVGLVLVSPAECLALAGVLFALARVVAILYRHAVPFGGQNFGVYLPGELAVDLHRFTPVLDERDGIALYAEDGRADPIPFAVTILPPAPEGES